MRNLELSKPEVFIPDLPFTLRLEKSPTQTYKRFVTVTRVQWRGSVPWVYIMELDVWMEYLGDPTTGNIDVMCFVAHNHPN